MLTIGLLNRNTGCQCCSVRCSSMLKLLCISIHIPNFSLDFQNFNFSAVRTVKRVELHHYAKFCRNRSNRNFSNFQDGGRRHVEFLKFQIFNGRKGRECRSASVCQITSKSVEPRPRYVNFNIMVVWLENAYSRPFLKFLVGTFPPK